MNQPIPETMKVTDSSLVKEISFNSHENSITATTIDGRVYTFPNLDRQTYEMFCSSPSKGRFFNELRKKK